MQNEKKTYFKGDFDKHIRLEREKCLPFKARQFRAS